MPLGFVFSDEFACILRLREWMARLCYEAINNWLSHITVKQRSVPTEGNSSFCQGHKHSEDCLTLRR